MAKIGDIKRVAGHEYKVWAIAYHPSNAKDDVDILKRRGYNARYILDKDYKGGFRQPKKRYLILGRK